MAPNLEDLEKEVSTAESTADIAALTAQILARVAAHSGMSAKQLQDAQHGLPAIVSNTNTIATNISNLADTTIAGRGDSKCPVHVTTSDDQPLRVAFCSEATEAIKGFLSVIRECADLKDRLDELAKEFCILQEHYGKHHHEHLKDPPVSGNPAKTYEGNT
jgi:hypothetical protein